MAKKGDLADLLGGFRSDGRIEKQDAAEPGDAGDDAATGVIRAAKVPGILDPIMAQLTPDEKFQFLSGIMDFMADFIVNMLDQYTFELSKVESSIANVQSTVLNQVRTIRNQVDIARQQGHFKAEGPPPVAFGIPGAFPGGSIAAAASSVGATVEPEKKRQATERDVMDIAASIRTLISRQKMAKPAAVQPAVEEAAAPAETAPEATGKASIDTKLQQFQKSADEQKQRIDRIASTAKPAAAPAMALPARSEKPAGKAKPAKAAARSKQGKAAPAAKPGPEPAARPSAGSNTNAPVAKLDKEKDMLPKGFQQELMKNIKGLIKEKGKEEKKPGAG